MSVMNKINAAAKSVASGSSKGKMSASGRLVATDLGSDMDLLINDLSKRQMMQATKSMAFILRQQVVANLRKGSSSSVIGESQKGKMTRGDWKSPSKTDGGVNYLKGGWYGEVLDKRGSSKKSMAFNGGDTHSGRGNKGIISRTRPSRNSWTSITGPRYGQDAKDNSRQGYNYAHMLEFGGAHKSWGNPAGNLSPRPFLGPAAAMARNKQVSKLTSMMKKWGKGQ